MCIDEMLYPIKNEISFKQYNPRRPAKYNLLFKSTTAVAYAFMHLIISYCGIPNEGATAYYVKEVEERVRYLQNL